MERTMRTSDECLQRMEALLRRLSTIAETESSHKLAMNFREVRSEACSIVAELDRYSPSKEALAYIKFEGVPAGPHWDNYPEWSNEGCAQAYDAGIAKGRELERNAQAGCANSKLVGIRLDNIARTYDSKGNLCHE